MEMTRAERYTLALSVVSAARQVFSEFPEIRLFPQMVYDVCASMHILFGAQGMGDAEIVKMLVSTQGTIAIAGSVYARMNGRYVGADSKAIKRGIL